MSFPHLLKRPLQHIFWSAAMIIGSAAVMIPLQLIGESREGESALHYHAGSPESIVSPTPLLNFTEALTMEAWIKPDGWGEGPNYLATIFYKPSIWLFIIENHATANDHSLILQLRHESGVSRTYSEVGSIQLNEWTHVAATYSASSGEVNIIINGAAQETGQISTASGPLRNNSGEAFQMGIVETGLMGFMGVIDEARLWNVARTESQINQHMTSMLTGSELGLQLYWPMNEGGGAEIHDMSGHGHDVSISGVEWTYGTPFSPTSIEESSYSTNVPQRTTLIGNYPNPFNPETTIHFTLRQAADVSLTVFDLSGKRVTQLADREYAAGAHQVFFSGEALSSGTFLYVMDTGGQRMVKRMVYLK